MVRENWTRLRPALEAEAPEASGVFAIWPGDGVPPGSEGWDWQERTAQIPWSDRPRRYSRNVAIPSVTLHQPPAGQANGTTLIVAPGGAFHFLMIDYEGHDMAHWLTGLGVTVCVLKYRVARTPDVDEEVMTFRDELQKRLAHSRGDNPRPSLLQEVRQMGEDDGRQAVRFVRAHAAEWGIDPARIGIAGYSAGGGVALGAALQHDAQSRPDFAVGIYASYRDGLAAPENPPPLFLAISDDDPSVPSLSSTHLYEAWHKAGGTAELHVFGNGAHGWGMAQDGVLADSWTRLFENWLRWRGLIP
ncbi:MAG: alpha/beta hydrolase fold domain-containing protein [Devosia sp.]|nr:alpha/beta hydrolase fold domain-containing protein [Devosia sp.]